jgi:cyclopropane-fatty-acyl-phospholipid synthase
MNYFMGIITWPLQAILTWIISHIEYGFLKVTLPNGKTRTFKGSQDGPHAEIKFADYRAFVKISFGEAMGLAESYMDGYWTTSNLADLLTMASMNLDHGTKKSRFFPVLQEPINKTIHALRPNSLKGAKKNVQATYDFGNDFYDLWLDWPTKAYTCAVFEKNDAVGPINPEPDKSITLAAAQVRKFERLLELADVRPDQRVFEAGCGWGRLAIHMAKTRGCHVVGVTLSEDQYRAACKAVEK